MNNFNSDLSIEVRAKKMVWLHTRQEEHDVETIAAVGKALKTPAVVWSFSTGLGGDVSLKNPAAAIDRMIARINEPEIMVMKDLHLFLGDPLVLRKTKDAVMAFRNSPKTLIVLSASANVHQELQDLFYFMESGLPSDEELAELVRTMAEDVQAENPDVRIDISNGTMEILTRSLRGLTSEEAANALSKSIIVKGGLDAENYTVLVEEKKALLKASDGLLEYIQPVPIEQVGGLHGIKTWVGKRKQAFTKAGKAFGLPAPKGILLVGVPGCGKSLTAKAVGSVLQIPILRLDMSKVFASHVGDSEGRMRRVIAIVSAMAPCILWIDEVEKALSGTNSDGDSGVSKRVFGIILTAMQEGMPGVFTVATANDISGLKPEFIRRFTETFYVDLPNERERQEIFRIHLGRVGRNPESFTMEDLVASTGNFSGAEIEKLIGEALYNAFDEGSELDTGYLTAAAETAKGSTIYAQYSAQIESAKATWKGRCKAASEEIQVQARTGRRLTLGQG